MRKNTLYLLSVIIIGGIIAVGTAHIRQVDADTSLEKVRKVTVSDVQGNRVTVEWKKVDRARSYHLRLLQQADDDSWDKIHVVTKIKKRSKTLKNLDPNTNYRLRIRAVRGSQRGAWSKAATFTTASEENVGDDDDSTTDCTSDETPVFTADITDLATVADIVPSPSLSGTVLKTHSFINTNLNTVPVYAPVDADLLSGAYYLETNPDGEYIFTFQVSCEITFILDHITDPTDEIRAVFADEPKDNTMSETPTTDVHVAAGDLIGYTTGTIYGIWDFGVYNSEEHNQFFDDGDTVERDFTAVCPYDFYASDDRSHYYDLFERADDRDYPGATEFCSAEAW
jgi:hypothetical protein